MSSTSDEAVEDRLIQVSEQLQIPTNTLQITQVRLGQLRNKPDIDEGNLDDFVAAALALSSREDGLPIADEAIANAWSQRLAQDGREITISQQLLETASIHLDIDEVPPHPNALVSRLGKAVEMPEQLITVARRLLQDAFEIDSTIISGGRSPAATAGGALSLAALVNGYDPDDVQDVLGGASKTSRMAVQSRCEDLEQLLGEQQLNDNRYQMADGTDTTVVESGEQATAADGAGRAASDETIETDGPGAADEFDDAEASSDADQTDESDETAPADSADASDETDPELAVGAVETEIETLVDELDVDASTRLLARGMVGDAVGEVDVGSAAELAGATLVAGLRLNDGDTDVVDVAALRAFEPRDVTQSLDSLDEAVDIDIPRRGADEIVEELVSERGLSEDVRAESHRALERYEADGGDGDFTVAELGAGVVVFAATVNGTQVDIEDLSTISGAGPSYITDAMNAVVVSLCQSLVRGDIAYEDCSWTTDLLESELSANLGDSQTGRAIAIAKTYTAGREGRHIDDATLDAVLGAE